MAKLDPKQRWDLVRGTNIQPSLRLTLYAIHCIQGNGRTAYCKRETLAAEVGVDVDTLSNKLKALNLLGVVRSIWTKRNGRPSREHSVDYARLREMQRPTLAVSSECESTPPNSPESTPPKLSVPLPRNSRSHSPEFTRHEDPEKIHRTSKSKHTQKTKFQKPTADDIRQYAAENKMPNFDAEYFIDYYESVGWKIGGKSPMKSWQATVRRWISKGGTDQHDSNAGLSEAVKAWQAVQDSVRRHSYFNPDKIIGDIGERSWQAVRSIGLKKIDEANDFDRRELQKRFIEEYQRQGAAA